MEKEMIRRHSDEAGATAVEYAIVMALIAAVIVLAVAFFGTSTSSLFDRPCQAMVNAGQAC